MHGFLDTVRDGHPATPLLLISPITCPAVEDVPGPTLSTRKESRPPGNAPTWPRAP
ncbi:hypothetical protein [Streptomyces eurocidicus]|uniref:hypothetical protein n=1 Tax=Streptomyces eurocidicus TaxID=66423 RepID=UPI003CC82743